MRHDSRTKEVYDLMVKRGRGGVTASDFPWAVHSARPLIAQIIELAVNEGIKIRTLPMHNHPNVYILRDV